MDDQPRGDARPPLRLHVAATAHNATRLRRQLYDWLVLDVPSSVVDDLTLAAYEALANVVEHAYADHVDGIGSLWLDAHRIDDQVLITVADEGGWRPAATERFRGRGLALMRHLVHDVRIDTNDGGTIVHLGGYFTPAGQPNSNGRCDH